MCCFSFTFCFFLEREVYMSDFRSGETHATVKFFEAKKGFGFATSPEGDLYISANLAYDYRNDLVPGTGLKVAYQSEERGLAITKIMSVLPRDPPEFCRGEVKFFDVKKGFGFITSAAFERDIFLHTSIASSAGIIPQEGLLLEFVVKERDGKLSAAIIRQTNKVVHFL